MRTSCLRARALRALRKRVLAVSDAVNNNHAVAHVTYIICTLAAATSMERPSSTAVLCIAEIYATSPHNRVV